jgi:hypothetical protein
MTEEYDYEEATPEEKLRIASYFLMNSPNGEIDEVLRGRSRSCQASPGSLIASSAKMFGSS